MRPPRGSRPHRSRLRAGRQRRSGQPRGKACWLVYQAFGIVLSAVFAGRLTGAFASCRADVRCAGSRRVCAVSIARRAAAPLARRRLLQPHTQAQALELRPKPPNGTRESQRARVERSREDSLLLQLPSISASVSATTPSAMTVPPARLVPRPCSRPARSACRAREGSAQSPQSELWRSKPQSDPPESPSVTV